MLDKLKAALTARVTPPNLHWPERLPGESYSAFWTRRLASQRAVKQNGKGATRTPAPLDKNGKMHPAVAKSFFLGDGLADKERKRRRVGVSTMGVRQYKKRRRELAKSYGYEEARRLYP